ncbi:MAG: 4Fe-4S dicluster domain-containing protein [Chloroflexota bacterium]|nr:4Fe-4S dicluster domain-containing protein [Chloroflexota bacterium]
MDQITTIVLSALALLWLLIFSTFGIISALEGERRASLVSLIITVSGSTFFLFAAFLPQIIQIIILFITATLILAGIVLFLLPIGRVEMGDDTLKTRFDERDVMFARARLRPSSPEYEAYYQRRPEHLEVDERTRAKPGLLSPNAKLADPVLFASPHGSFFLTEALRDAVDGAVAEDRQQLSSEAMTRYLKDLAIYYGSLAVGITTVEPYHVYSHIGRGSGTYGDPIPLDNTYAIAFTVEMDFDMMGSSPEAPVVMESARQYVESARVAVQLAAAIRALGCSARAHIDGNYRVIAPLVARDAGLGEIGRMGLLMTSSHGPRVRLGVVTTDAELIPDIRTPDPAMIDFCNICNKCAENCPSKSILFGERQEIEGALRWKIDAETCFHYWNVIGTDCGRCIAVCPYSHPATFSHNLIRWGNDRSGAFRRGSNWLDDLFYGEKPIHREAPLWTHVK